MKKMVIIAIILLMILGIFFLVNKNNIINEDNRIHDVLSLIDDESIDITFINWVSSKYNKDIVNELYEVIDNGKYDNEIWHQLTGNSYIVLMDIYNDRYKDTDNVRIIDKKGLVSLGFVGDVSLADNFEIMPKYDERGKGIFGILSEETVNTMKSIDIMVANNEFTISERGNAMSGKMYTFRALPKRVSIYDEMGVDLVTLANNHVFDFGEDAFNDMLDILKEHNMPYIGAGRNIDEAMKPYYFVINGYKIGFVNATRAEKNVLTPGATENSSGVLRCYDTTNFKKVIENTKRESDYVIALVHYGREDSHLLEDEQISSSKEYIDSGADVVIGTHAHLLQGIEFYNNRLIFYNLGDFIFNREDKNTGLLKIEIDDAGDMKYYFIPARQHNYYTELLYNNDKQAVIDKMNGYSINALINEDGQITVNSVK